MKTIIEFDEEEQKKVNIQNVALDVFRRRIYWTDPTMTEGEGRIESANLDGTDRKVILKKLHWPQGMESHRILRAFLLTLYVRLLAYLLTMLEFLHTLLALLLT